MTAQRNPFAYAKPITLDTLGDLFGHHRSLTGGWSMEDPPAPPAPPPADPPAPTPPPPTPPPPTDPPAFEAITTQEDFDKRLGQRIAREREKFADYPELKEKAEKYDAAEEANRTEHEKAVEAARREGESVATARTNVRLVAAEAKVLLTQAGAHNPAAAAALLGDLSAITVSEAGEVDQASVKAKVDALKASDAYLFGTGTPPPPRPDPSQGGGGGGGSEKPGSIAEARERARAEREAKRPKTA